MIRILVVSCLLLWVNPSMVSAAGGQYDSDSAGHPFRVAAYVLHPIGVLLDRVIFHPAWSLAQHEPIRTWVGMRTEDYEEAERLSTNPFLEPYTERKENR